MRNTEIAPIERAKQVLSFDETKAKLAELAVQEAQRKVEEDARQEAEAKAKAEREARAAAEQERIAMVIANATLAESAREAVELLEDNGLGEHLVTRKLRAAIERMECAA